MRAAADPALDRLTVVASVGGPRQHRVLRGHPAEATAPPPARHLLRGARRAQDPGLAVLHQHGALGVIQPSPGKAHLPQLVRGPSVWTCHAGQLTGEISGCTACAPRAILRGRATLIDWGGCRVGPAALDLANLVAADSADVARYAGTWQRLTGQPLPAGPVELGYRWAALQIPVQYLPWGAGHRPTGDVEAALDQIERAISGLTQLAR